MAISQVELTLAEAFKLVELGVSAWITRGFPPTVLARAMELRAQQLRGELGRQPEQDLDPEEIRAAWLSMAEQSIREHQALLAHRNQSPMN